MLRDVEVNEDKRTVYRRGGRVREGQDKERGTK